MLLLYIIPLIGLICVRLLWLRQITTVIAIGITTTIAYSAFVATVIVWTAQHNDLLMYLFGCVVSTLLTYLLLIALLPYRRDVTTAERYAVALLPAYAALLQFLPCLLYLYLVPLVS
jgi:hypothetical protein